MFTILGVGLFYLIVGTFFAAWILKGRDDFESPDEMINEIQALIISWPLGVSSIMCLKIMQWLEGAK